MADCSLYPTLRLRRLRHHRAIRDFVRETQLSVNDFVLPLFIKHGVGIKNPIASMPGHFQLSVDRLDEELQSIIALGIKTIILFGIPEHKDALGQDSYHNSGIIQTAIPVIKKIAPQLLI